MATAGVCARTKRDIAGGREGGGVEEVRAAETCAVGVCVATEARAWRLPCRAAVARSERLRSGDTTAFPE